MRKIRLKRVSLFALLFATMTMFGFIENIRGVSYPLIRSEFSVPFERQGLMVSMLSMGFVVANVIAGVVLGRFGIKPVALSGYLIICAGLVLVFFMPSFFFVAAALFVLTGGFGFLDIGINALASKVFATKAALLMNLLHSFYGLGSILGPRVGGGIISGTEFTWRYVYLFALPLVLLPFALAIFLRFPKDDAEAQAETSAGVASGAGVDAGALVERKSYLDALKTPMVWLLGLTLGLALVIQMSTPNWGPLYFQDVFGLDPVTEGAAFLSTFFLLFTLSRIILGPLVEKIGYVRSLLGASALAFAVFAVGFSMGARGIFVLPALGILIALFWPTMMAVAIVSFGKDTPVYAGAMIAIAGLVNSVLQFLVGLTNRVIGPAWGYRSGMIYVAALFFVLLLLYKNLKRRGVKNI